MSATELMDNTYYAMDDALRDLVVVPLEYDPQNRETGLSVTIEDLERLFPLMAKAAHLFRIYDGPAPAHWSDTWKLAVSRCAAVCRTASTVYLSLCIDKGRTIGGEIRERLNAWDYMANMFATWPARSGTTRAEPSSITAAAGIRPVETETEVEVGKPLYCLPTVYNRQQLASIFSRLVTAGYIDGSAPDAAQNFCNSFDQATDRQGRISWIWTDKRSRKVAPRHILDFVAQMDGGSLAGITPELYNRTAPAIFGRPFGRDIVSEFVYRWNAGKYCDTHADIYAIISGQ